MPVCQREMTAGPAMPRVPPFLVGVRYAPVGEFEQAGCCRRFGRIGCPSAAVTASGMPSTSNGWAIGAQAFDQGTVPRVDSFKGSARTRRRPSARRCRRYEPSRRRSRDHAGRGRRSCARRSLIGLKVGGRLCAHWRGLFEAGRRTGAGFSASGLVRVRCAGAGRGRRSLRPAGGIPDGWCPGRAQRARWRFGMRTASGAESRIDRRPPPTDAPRHE